MPSTSPPRHTRQRPLTTTFTYENVRDGALAVERLYAENGVALPVSSDLAKHIADSKLVTSLWFAGRGEEISLQSLYHAVQMRRIGDAFASVHSSEQRENLLRILVHGSLDVFDRVQSQGKDFLWEMEFCATLSSRGFNAILAEPDIVIKLGTTKVGVACKKIYSESGVEKALSNGVAQIEATHGVGFLAINIDELLPQDHVLVTQSEKALLQALNGDNLVFLKTHGRHFRKYLSAGRSICALIASGGVAVINGTPHTTRQYTIWSIPGLDNARTHLMNQLQEGFTE